MSRDESVITNQSGPLLFEIGKRDSPIDLLGSSIAAYYKLETPLRSLVDESFVKGSIVIEGDFGARTKESWHTFDDTVGGGRRSRSIVSA